MKADRFEDCDALILATEDGRKAGARDRHWEGYRRVMRTGSTRYGTQVLRVPALHKDGHRVSIAFTVALLFKPSGSVKSIAAIVRDETERWQEERALRDRVAQLEALAQGNEAGPGSPH